MAGIEQTLEVLKALNTTAEQLKAALADGKLGITDLPKLLPVVRDLKTAIEGCKEIPEELKELNGAEISQMFESLMSIVNTILSIVTGNK